MVDGLLRDSKVLCTIKRDANTIAQKRRGKGNMIICSSDVISALQMAGVLDYLCIKQQLKH